MFIVLQFWADGIRDKQAELRTAALEAQTAEANRETARLSKEAEGLRAQAEADRLARVKIEQKLAPRSLSNEQQAAIRLAIARFAPQMYEFVSYQDDPEVVQLVHTLIPMLQFAGWKGQPAKGFLLAQLETGVRVEFAPEDAAALSSAAKALADALSANGIAATFGDRAGLEKTAVLRIRVGKKP